MAEILTNNAMFSSFMIVLIVFALGDIVGKITKGKLSGMMVVMLLFLVGFLTKLIPADIIDQGGLTALSKLAIAMVLFNMGTTLNVKQLIEEWRTVLMAALCMLASCLVMLLVSPIIGFDTMLVGMPVINGAAMATSLMAPQQKKDWQRRQRSVQSSIPYRNSSVRRSHLPWVSVTEKNC